MSSYFPDANGQTAFHEQTSALPTNACCFIMYR
jgi:hypothetical protein